MKCNKKDLQNEMQFIYKDQTLIKIEGIEISNNL